MQSYSCFNSEQPFLQKKKTKIQNFPKIWLREVHACQRILKFEVFIIFVFLDVFSARGGGRHERKKRTSTFSLGWYLQPALRGEGGFSPNWRHQPGLKVTKGIVTFSPG
jgi:hypothetical protein